MATSERPKQPQPTSKPVPSPTSQPRSESNTPASTLRQASLDPRTLTPAQVIQLQRTIGNRAVTQYMRANQHPPQVNRIAPAGPVVIQREVEVKQEEIKEKWKSTPFKTIYLLTNGQLLSVHKEESDIVKEFAAYQKITEANMGIKTPRPELVEYQGKKAIRMDKVDGNFIDFNKIDSTSVLYKLMILTASGREFEVNENVVTKLANMGVPTENAKWKVLKKMREELEILLNAQKTVVISDLQAIVDIKGNVVVIDPLGADDPKELKVGKKMLEDTYKRIQTIAKSLGDTEKELKDKKLKEKALDANKNQ